MPGLATADLMSYFELMLITGELVNVEIKPERRLAEIDIQHKLGCISMQMQRLDMSFLVLPDTVIRAEPRLSALRWIFHQSPRIHPTTESCRMALLKVGDVFPTSIKNLAIRLNEYGVNPFSMLMSGMLHCSLSTPVTPETFVNPIEELDDAWFYIAKEYGF